PSIYFFFFTAPTPSLTCTLSLHDALPIFDAHRFSAGIAELPQRRFVIGPVFPDLHDEFEENLAPEEFFHAPPGLASDRLQLGTRSEEHTSELQSRENLVCRLLLEKKKKIT